jgi:uncharacterized protein (TIGR03437 family)
MDPALEICNWGSLVPTVCSDAYVAKFDTAGELTWISFFHGTHDESIAQMRLDSTESVYVAGSTTSDDFPVTAGALQSAYGGPTPPAKYSIPPRSVTGDMFLARLNPTDGLPVYSTFLGGPEAEWASKLRVDASGHAYVFGSAKSGIPITSSAMKTTPSCTECVLGYVAKVDPSGSRPIYATYLPASPKAADVDASGSVYFVGTAKAGEISPTTGAYQATPGGNGDGFVAKLAKDGSALEYATYIGGADYDYTNAVVADSQGNVWTRTVTGLKNQTYRLVKLDGRGSRILVESHGGETPVAVDSHDNLWVTAWPPATTLAATSDALLGKDCSRGMLAKLSPDWKVLFATYTSMTVYGVNSNDAPLVDTSPGIGTLDLSVPTPPGIGCVASSANWNPNLIAPGQLVTLFGKGLGPAKGAVYTVGNDNRVDTTLAGTRVLFDGVAAPLLYAQAEQLNAIVPFGTVTNRSAKITVEYQGETVATTTSTMVDSIFAFFTLDGTGKGQAAAFNEDGTLNSPANPAKRGSIVSAWGTGAGKTTPQSEDGVVTGSAPPRFIAGGWIGMKPADLVYAGAAPGLVAGVSQVNIRIPADYSDSTYPLSAVPIWILTKGRSSPTVGTTIAVK